MKFTCTRDNLSNALDLVSGIASKQTNLPILLNILITVSESKVELVSTDLEIAVRVHVRAKVEAEGSFTVPAKTMADFIRLLSDDQVVISLEGQELKITSGNSSTKIKGMPADDFPIIPPLEEDHHYVLDPHVFKDALARVLVAVAKNEIRPELSGMCMNLFSERYSGLTLAATDSYRLAEEKVLVKQGEDTFSCIVPSRTVGEMIRLISLTKDEEANEPVRLWLSGKQIAIRMGKCEMTSRLVDGRYPDYPQIIPTQFKTKAFLPVDLLVKKIKAASLFTMSGVNAVSFVLKPKDGVVEISSLSTQTGEHASSIEATVEGEENTILLNHRYTLDGLNHMGDADVEFAMNSADTPCLFRAKKNQNFLYIVMPIRQ